MNMSELNEKKELDPTLLRKLEFRIFSYEHENHKTKKLTDSEMVQRIRKLIDEYVRTEDQQ
jgi:hypothetical protein